MKVNSTRFSGFLSVGLKLVVSAALLVLLSRRVDWGTMSRVSGDLEWFSIFVAMLAFALVACLEAARLRVVLSRFSLRWLDMFRLHFVGIFFGNFLPGELGGDVYKVAALRERFGGVTRLAALMVVLRLFGLAALLPVAGVSSFLLWSTISEWFSAVKFRSPPWLSSSGGWLVVAGIATCAVAALWLQLQRPKARKWLAARLRAAREELSMIRPAQAMVLFFLSLLVFFARAATLMFLAGAVGAKVSPAAGLWVVSAATLVALLPVSFAGLGVREGVIALMLARLSVEYEDALMVALLGRALILVMSVVGGGWLVAEFASQRAAGSIVGRDAER